ncbi:hypothetical protein H4R34_006475, partial [Dimargaris verticillata]
MGPPSVSEANVPNPTLQKAEDKQSTVSDHMTPREKKEAILAQRGNETQKKFADAMHEIH